MSTRTAQIDRATGETRITLKLKIDGKGKSSIDTGIPFFDHMLTLFAKHAVCDLQVQCDGDLDVDLHHAVEDVGIALGQAYWQALGEKRGIRRYGTGFDPRNPLWGEAHLPMDETLTRAVIDFSGRPYLVWNGMDKLGFKVVKGEQNQDDACRFRFGLARNFSKASPMKPAATCTLNCCTVRNRITWWRRCSRPLPRRSILPAKKIPALAGLCRARKGA